MARVGLWSVLCCVLCIVLRVIRTENVVPAHSVLPSRTRSPAPEFSAHTVIKPRVYHRREKREITSTKENGEHIHDLTIGYDINGKDYVLDLRLNRELVPKSYFEKYQHNGQHVVNKPTGKDVELCQYQGELRGVRDSWAAISTCHGLSGVIFDGEELHYLERGFTDEGGGGEDEGITSTHFLYHHSDVKTNKTCGYSGTSHHILDNQEFNRILRYKRSTDVIRGPYNANKQSRYVELVLVVDNKEYKELGESKERVYQHCKEIANIINALYVPLNIFIALVGVVVWTEHDEITLNTNGDTTLTNFLHYRRERLVKDHPNDNAQLLTRVQFEGGVVGKALKGPICTFEFSGGVSMDHSSVVGLVATTVAHEMGHNFGMEHDNNECECPSDRCIMAPSSSSMSPTQWSSCSLEYLALAFEHGMDYCLRNKPQSLFDSPVCGNGFVEAGEQCDCGLKDRCDNPCCNATSCMLYVNASCATGECCDLKTCRPKTAGTVCRSADHECDLPEYCTGQSEYCPDDVFKMDGETCDRGKAFCYQGSCRTHTDQCRLLWGPSGSSSDLQCYQMNTKGTRHGNCGYNRLNQSYIKCNDENIYCGMLHCRHLNERLEFGMESVAILSHSFINAGGKIIPCRTAIVDLGLNQVDPGLAPDGAKCGEGKMCVNQKCMAVGSLRKEAGAGICPQDCNGNGVCNSRGHCHCAMGFAPPLCDYPGTGGSEDSGPASDPNARYEVMTALYVIFLGIVPFLALISLFMYYTRRNVKHWWKKSGGHPAGTTTTGSSQPPSEKKSAQPRRISWGNSLANGNVRGLEISGPLPADGSGTTDSAHASLLPKTADGSNGVIPIINPSSNNPPAGAPNGFFGQFKGFSLTPLPSNNSSPNKVPPASPPAKNQVPAPNASTTAPAVPLKTTKPATVVAPSRSNSTATSRVVSSTVSSTTATATSAAPVLPAVHTSSASRPLISSPILDATTCTAKELISSSNPSVPTRPAPEVPISGSAAPAGYTPLTDPSEQKPARPLSSPNSLSVGTIPPPPPSQQQLDDKKGKDNGPSYPTLTRLASFMMRQNQNQNQAINEKGKGKDKGGTNSLPRTHHHGVKANKLQIDREALRNLQISNPIPQQDIEVPENAVPVRPAPSPPADVEEGSNKQVVMRAQSLRDKGPVTQRPNIPTFGSMRQPGTGGSGRAKRPTSIPAGTRPTSPPPPRPPPPPHTGNKPGDLPTGIIGMPGYQNPPAVSQTDYCYDDCFNLLSDDAAPLANIDEESSPNSGDNIYAVIEESPTDRSRKKIVGSSSPVSEYAAPVPPKIGAGVDSVRSPGSKFEYTSPNFSEYKSPKPVENSISAGSVESVGLLSEIVNEIQARNMESIYSSSTFGGKKNGEGSDIDDASSTITATDSSVAGSISSPRLFRDKSSAIASSNSSLGTYVNASNIYRPSSSLYSNMSMRNNAASSPQPNSTKSSNSSASSSSGYLSPTSINITKPAPTLTSTSSSAPSTTAPAKDFSTFKSPSTTANVSVPKTTAPTLSATTTTPTEAKKTTQTITALPENVSSYKPFHSTLQRSLGPLASSYRNANSTPTSVSNSDATKVMSSQNTTAEQGVPPAVPSRNLPTKETINNKVSPSPVAQKPSQNEKVATTATSKPVTATPPTATQTNRPSLSRSTTPPSLSTKLSTAGSNSMKGTSSTSAAKGPPTATVNSSALHNRGKIPPNIGSRGQTPPASNSPDLVSSCGTSAVKADVKKTPDVVSGPTRPLPSLPARNTPTSGTGRSASSSGSSVGKPLVGSGNRQSPVSSSFRSSTSSKQPQTAPKPSLLRQSPVGNNMSATKDDSIGKGRGISLNKSASDVGTRSMPPAARAAASKLSHVASLQQKFETAAVNEKAGNVANKVAVSASAKTRGVTASAKSAEPATGKGTGFKK